MDDESKGIYRLSLTVGFDAGVFTLRGTSLTDPLKLI